MKIADIKPYEDNARYNEKAIPIVAESIKTFGFKGAIVLRSHEDPTIVNGHTRIEACKLLGWTEFPDEYICYADELTDDEVKALRLADNRTGEIATWNKALLKREVRTLDKSGLNMSRFNFDFKSKILPYGAERLKTDKAYNLDIVNVSNCGKDGMPLLKAINYVPDHLIGFNYAKSSDDNLAGIHFFVDDYQFERCWNEPSKYVDMLREFDCVLTPDFSLYMDMPLPMQQWNIYRSRALGFYWQSMGMKVIPTLSWSVPKSYNFCFSGLEPKGTYAVSTVGVKNNKDAIKIWHDGMAYAMKKLKPIRILQYGGDIGFDFGESEVVNYKNNVTERMRNGG